MTRLVALMLAATLAGCACTAEGCNNQVRFDPHQDLLPEVEYQVRVCIDDRCEEATLAAEGPPSDVAGLSGPLTLWADLDRIDFALGDGDFSGASRIALDLRDAEGVVLATFDEVMELTRSAPNGGLCGPVCWSAAVEALPVE